MNLEDIKPLLSGLQVEGLEKIVSMYYREKLSIEHKSLDETCLDKNFDSDAIVNRITIINQAKKISDDMFKDLKKKIGG